VELKHIGFFAECRKRETGINRSGQEALGQRPGKIRSNAACKSLRIGEKGSKNKPEKESLKRAMVIVPVEH